MSATAQELVDASARIYTDSTNWEHYWTRDNVIVGHSIAEDGSDIIVFRGSKTTIDWLRDFNFVAIWDHEIGMCEAGFITDMDDVIKEILSSIKMRTLAITGHSLGGARARLATAKLAVRGEKVDRLLTFGSPAPGYINIRRVIEKSGMKHQSVRNNNDVVPDTPIPIPIVLPYCHTEEYLQAYVPAPEDNFHALRDHSVNLYQSAVQQLVAKGVL